MLEVKPGAEEIFLKEIEERGLKQNFLYKKAGVPKTSYYTHKKKFNVAFAIKMAVALGHNPNYFLQLKDSN